MHDDTRHKHERIREIIWRHINEQRVDGAVARAFGVDNIVSIERC